MHRPPPRAASLIARRGAPQRRRVLTARRCSPSISPSTVAISVWAMIDTRRRGSGEAVEEGVELGFVDISGGAALKIGETDRELPMQRLELHRVPCTALLQRAHGFARHLAGVRGYRLRDERDVLIGATDVALGYGASLLLVLATVTTAATATTPPEGATTLIAVVARDRCVLGPYR